MFTTIFLAVSFANAGVDADLESIRAICMKKLDVVVDRRKKVCECHVQNLKLNIVPEEISVLQKIYAGTINPSKLPPGEEHGPAQTYDLDSIKGCMKDPSKRIAKANQKPSGAADTDHLDGEKKPAKKE